MAYYVLSDYSGYYEGVRVNVSDIEVTERPHVVCEWDGAAWTYPLAAAQDYQKARVSRAMRDDLRSSLATSYIEIDELVLIASLGIEATAFEDDTGRSSASVPMLEGYRAEAALGTLQNAADDIQSRFAFGLGVMGAALARRMGLFDQIDAETDGETVLTYEWTPL